MSRLSEVQQCLVPSAMPKPLMVPFCATSILPLSNATAAVSGFACLSLESALTVLELAEVFLTTSTEELIKTAITTAVVSTMVSGNPIFRKTLQ